MEINTQQQKPALGDRISVDPGYGTPTEGIVFTVAPLLDDDGPYEAYNIASQNGLTYCRTSRNKITILERANYTYAPRGHFRVGDLAELLNGERVLILQDGVSPSGSCRVVTVKIGSTTFFVAEQELTLIHAANHPPAPVDELAEALNVPKAAVDMSHAELDRELDEFCVQEQEEIPF